MIGSNPMVYFLLFIVFYFLGLLMMYFGEYLITKQKEVTMSNNTQPNNNFNEPIGTMILYTKDLSVEISASGLLS